MKITSIYFTSLLIFGVLDFIWLAFIAKNLYKNWIGHLMAERPNLLAAVIFYLLFIAGLMYFSIIPAIKYNDFSYAITSGMFFGFITYATYDLTNLATLKNWPLTMTIVDMIWGSLISLSVSLLTFLIHKK